jgi:large subunit ribosomal protein L19
MKSSNLTRETILDIQTTPRNFDEFSVGDHIEIDQIVQEGNKERIQKFTGDVIAYHKNGIGTSFTVRRIASGGVGVERIIPYYSPNISAIRLVRKGKVRRAKLFYLRKAIGKAARIKEDLSAKRRAK